MRRSSTLNGQAPLELQRPGEDKGPPLPTQGEEGAPLEPQQDDEGPPWPRRGEEGAPLPYEHVGQVLDAYLEELNLEPISPPPTAVLETGNLRAL